VIGHEFTGVVEEVGPEVRRFHPGDRVVASFFTACGHCYLCRRGWFAQCENKGTFGHGEYFGDLGGGQAEWVVVPLADHTLEPIPAGMSDEQAIFVGDILSTAYFGAERAEIHPGHTMAVVGPGPVGPMGGMAANPFGPARVYAVDMVDARLEVAQELGAIPVHAEHVHPVEFLQQVTEGHGVDRSIECVGHVSAVETAIHCVRGGGTISMVGIPSKTGVVLPPHARLDEGPHLPGGLVQRAGLHAAPARPDRRRQAAAGPHHLPPHAAGGGAGGLPDVRRPGSDQDRPHPLDQSQDGRTARRATAPAPAPIATGISATSSS